VTLHGVTLAPGDTINCMLGAANRDPAIFDRPHAYTLHRPNLSRHLGFAAGPHFCLGSHLARLEADCALRALFRRLPGLRLADPAQVEVRGAEFRQPRSLPVVWDG
jgi:cytochrome P450